MNDTRLGLTHQRRVARAWKALANGRAEVVARRNMLTLKARTATEAYKRAPSREREERLIKAVRAVIWHHDPTHAQAAAMRRCDRAFQRLQSLGERP